MSYKNKNNLNDLTVVIPSIVRNKDLNETILFLNQGSNKPKQIIAIIPKAELINLNLKIHKKSYHICFKSIWTSRPKNSWFQII